MAEIFLTPVELAKRWKMSVNTLNNWRVQKTGPVFLKVGNGLRGKVLYRLDDIELYERDRRPELTSEPRPR
jgi:hypothetical protein